MPSALSTFVNAAGTPSSAKVTAAAVDTAFDTETLLVRETVLV
jgi:hypothetical protein